LCSVVVWERAARGADGRVYTTGARLVPSNANFDLTYGRRDGGFGPDEVGRHPASASVFGVEDLAGNASELVRSARWRETVVYRGGSWFRDRASQRLDNRFQITADVRDLQIGVRICADLRADLRADLQNEDGTKLADPRVQPRSPHEGL
jgi:formylglycine-generating enzyme required for sulfatase activity